MHISFDLDDTLICYGGDDAGCEPRLPWWARMVLRDEPLRKGTRRLAVELHRHGHRIWIYTSSGRTVRWIKWWLRLHGVRVEGVINGPMHVKCFGAGSSPSKRPHAFKIALHVDNSPGVAIEGEQHGFNVCLVEPSATDWVEQVLTAVDRYHPTSTSAARA
ncbi:MAG TPA: hypothetical protein VGI81_08620 [Tepidisphaeraceae bacterium]|jgi:hypothetical protein